MPAHLEIEIPDPIADKVFAFLKRLDTEEAALKAIAHDPLDLDIMAATLRRLIREFEAGYARRQGGSPATR